MCTPKASYILASSAKLADIQAPKTTEHTTFKIPLDQQVGQRQTYHTEVSAQQQPQNIQTAGREFRRQIALA